MDKLEIIKDQLKSAIKELQEINDDRTQLCFDCIDHALHLADNLDSVENWIKYEIGIEISYPGEYGKYWVCRKDGKIHQETWSGTGWAYNNNSIAYYAKIEKPEEFRKA